MIRRTGLKRTGFARSKAGVSAGARNVRTAPPRPPAISAADREYMARVRELPCSARFLPGHPECSGPPVVHHAGRHGMGQKCPHTETIRLCDLAHRNLHDLNPNGCFAGWSREQLRSWEDQQIAITQHVLNYQAQGDL